MGDAGGGEGRAGRGGGRGEVEKTFSVFFCTCFTQKLDVTSEINKYIECTNDINEAQMSVVFVAFVLQSC